MIFLYSFILFLLGGVKFLVQRRAAALGRRYSALAGNVQALVQALGQRPGRADLSQAARQQYELALLVNRRDRAEARHFAWQAGAEGLDRWARRLRDWKGRKLPYTMGVVDVWLVLTLIDHLGVGQYLSAGPLLQLVTSLWGQG